MRLKCLQLLIVFTTVVIIAHADSFNSEEDGLKPSLSCILWGDVGCKKKCSLLCMAFHCISCNPQCNTVFCDCQERLPIKFLNVIPNTANSADLPPDVTFKQLLVVKFMRTPVFRDLDKVMPTVPDLEFEVTKFLYTTDLSGRELKQEMKHRFPKLRPLFRRLRPRPLAQMDPNISAEVLKQGINIEEEQSSPQSSYFSLWLKPKPKKNDVNSPENQKRIINLIKKLPYKHDILETFEVLRDSPEKQLYQNICRYFLTQGMQSPSGSFIVKPAVNPDDIEKKVLNNDVIKQLQDKIDQSKEQKKSRKEKRKQNSSENSSEEKETKKLKLDHNQSQAQSPNNEWWTPSFWNSGGQSEKDNIPLDAKNQSSKPSDGWWGWGSGKERNPTNSDGTNQPGAPSLTDITNAPNGPMPPNGQSPNQGLNSAGSWKWSSWNWPAGSDPQSKDLLNSNQSPIQSDSPTALTSIGLPITTINNGRSLDSGEVINPSNGEIDSKKLSKKKDRNKQEKTEKTKDLPEDVFPYMESIEKNLGNPKKHHKYKKSKHSLEESDSNSTLLKETSPKHKKKNKHYINPSDNDESTIEYNTREDDAPGKHKKKKKYHKKPSHSDESSGEEITPPKFQSKHKKKKKHHKTPDGDERSSKEVAPLGSQSKHEKKKHDKSLNDLDDVSAIQVLPDGDSKHKKIRKYSDVDEDDNDENTTGKLSPLSTSSKQKKTKKKFSTDDHSSEESSSEEILSIETIEKHKKKNKTKDKPPDVSNKSKSPSKYDEDSNESSSEKILLNGTEHKKKKKRDKPFDILNKSKISSNKSKDSDKSSSEEISLAGKVKNHKKEKKKLEQGLSPYCKNNNSDESAIKNELSLPFSSKLNKKFKNGTNVLASTNVSINTPETSDRSNTPSKTKLQKNKDVTTAITPNYLNYSDLSQIPESKLLSGLAGLLSTHAQNIDSLENPIPEIKPGEAPIFKGTDTFDNPITEGKLRDKSDFKSIDAPENSIFKGTPVVALGNPTSNSKFGDMPIANVVDTFANSIPKGKPVVDAADNKILENKLGDISSVEVVDVLGNSIPEGKEVDTFDDLILEIKPIADALQKSIQEGKPLVDAQENPIPRSKLKDMLKDIKIFDAFGNPIHENKQGEKPNTKGIDVLGDTILEGNNELSQEILEHIPNSTPNPTTSTNMHGNPISGGNIDINMKPNSSSLPDITPSAISSEIELSHEMSIPKDQSIPMVQIFQDALNSSPNLISDQSLTMYKGSRDLSNHTPEDVFPPSYSQRLPKKEPISYKSLLNSKKAQDNSALSSSSPTSTITENGLMPFESLSDSKMLPPSLKQALNIQIGDSNKPNTVLGNKQSILNSPLNFINDIYADKMQPAGSSSINVSSVADPFYSEGSSTGVTPKDLSKLSPMNLHENKLNDGKPLNLTFEEHHTPQNFGSDSSAQNILSLPENTMVKQLWSKGLLPDSMTSDEQLKKLVNKLKFGDLSSSGVPNSSDPSSSKLDPTKQSHDDNLDALVNRLKIGSPLPKPSASSFENGSDSNSNAAKTFTENLINKIITGNSPSAGKQNLSSEAPSITDQYTPKDPEDKYLEGLVNQPKSGGNSLQTVTLDPTTEPKDVPLQRLVDKLELGKDPLHQSQNLSNGDVDAIFSPHDLFQNLKPSEMNTNSAPIDQLGSNPSPKKKFQLPPPKNSTHTPYGLFLPTVQSELSNNSIGTGSNGMPQIPENTTITPNKLLRKLKGKNFGGPLVHNSSPFAALPNGLSPFSSTKHENSLLLPLPKNLPTVLPSISNNLLENTCSPISPLENPMDLSYSELNPEQIPMISSEKIINNLSNMVLPNGLPNSLILNTDPLILPEPLEIDSLFSPLSKDISPLDQRTNNLLTNSANAPTPVKLINHSPMKLNDPSPLLRGEKSTSQSQLGIIGDTASPLNIESPFPSKKNPLQNYFQDGFQSISPSPKQLPTGLLSEPKNDQASSDSPSRDKIPNTDDLSKLDSSAQNLNAVPLSEKDIPESRSSLQQMPLSLLSPILMPTDGNPFEALLPDLAKPSRNTTPSSVELLTDNSTSTPSKLSIDDTQLTKSPIEIRSTVDSSLSSNAGRSLNQESPPSLNSLLEPQNMPEFLSDIPISANSLNTAHDSLNQSPKLSTSNPMGISVDATSGIPTSKTMPLPLESNPKFSSLLNTLKNTNLNTPNNNFNPLSEDSLMPPNAIPSSPIDILNPLSSLKTSTLAGDPHFPNEMPIDFPQTGMSPVGHLPDSQPLTLLDNVPILPSNLGPVWSNLPLSTHQVNPIDNLNGSPQNALNHILPQDQATIPSEKLDVGLLTSKSSPITIEKKLPSLLNDNTHASYLSLNGPNPSTISSPAILTPSILNLTTSDKKLDFRPLPENPLPLIPGKTSSSLNNTFNPRVSSPPTNDLALGNELKNGMFSRPNNSPDRFEQVSFSPANAPSPQQSFTPNGPILDYPTVTYPVHGTIIPDNAIPKDLKPGAIPVNNVLNPPKSTIPWLNDFDKPISNPLKDDPHKNVMSSIQPVTDDRNVVLPLTQSLPEVNKTPDLLINNSNSMSTTPTRNQNQLPPDSMPLTAFSINGILTPDYTTTTQQEDGISKSITPEPQDSSSPSNIPKSISITPVHPHSLLNPSIPSKSASSPNNHSSGVNSNSFKPLGNTSVPSSLLSNVSSAPQSSSAIPNADSPKTLLHSSSSIEDLEDSIPWIDDEINISDDSMEFLHNRPKPLFKSPTKLSSSLPNTRKFPKPNDMSSTFVPLLPLQALDSFLAPKHLEAASAAPLSPYGAESIKPPSNMNPDSTASILTTTPFSSSLITNKLPQSTNSPTPSILNDLPKNPLNYPNQAPLLPSPLLGTGNQSLLKIKLPGNDNPSLSIPLSASLPHQTTSNASPTSMINPTSTQQPLVATSPSKPPAFPDLKESLFTSEGSPSDVFSVENPKDHPSSSNSPSPKILSKPPASPSIVTPPPGAKKSSLDLNKLFTSEEIPSDVRSEEYITSSPLANPSSSHKVLAPTSLFNNVQTPSIPPTSSPLSNFNKLPTNIFAGFDDLPATPPSLDSFKPLKLPSSPMANFDKPITMLKSTSKPQSQLVQSVTSASKNSGQNWRDKLSQKKAFQPLS